MKTAHLRPAIIAAFVAILGYAAQHPLVKPLAERLSSTTGDFATRLNGAAKATLIAEVIAFVLTLAILLIPSGRNMLRQMLMGRNIAATLILSAFAVSTTVLYMFNIASFDPSYVASVSNIFPAYYVVGAFLWTARDPQKRPSTKRLALAVAASVAIAIAVVGTTEPSVSGLIENPVGRFAWVSIVPILFVVRALALSRSYQIEGAWNTVLSVIVIAGFDAPIAIALAAGWIWSSTGTPFFSIPDDITLYLFVAGTIASGVIGGGGFQVALRLSGPNGWAPTMLFFLIPVLVLLASPVIFIFFGVEVQRITFNSVLSGCMVSLILLAYFITAYWKDILYAKRGTTSDSN